MIYCKYAALTGLSRPSAKSVIISRFHPTGENSESPEVLILQAGNHIQAKESLNLD
ncbi:Uncharacterized protein dnm_098530 [Desulfonema magnum]|uniref:Uncharacterized protein n=1 Tax=Desulfonema magnum TaxID=45655 RepID=A0A975GU36_9BACT|nr:Uncharacterized protein dnm_098530 [Desulfonema magnum]